MTEIHGYRRDLLRCGRSIARASPIGGGKNWLLLMVSRTGCGLGELSSLGLRDVTVRRDGLGRHPDVVRPPIVTWPPATWAAPTAGIEPLTYLCGNSSPAVLRRWTSTDRAGNWRLTFLRLLMTASCWTLRLRSCTRVVVRDGARRDDGKGTVSSARRAAAALRRPRFPERIEGRSLQPKRLPPCTPRSRGNPWGSGRRLREPTGRHTRPVHSLGPVCFRHSLSRPHGLARRVPDCFT